MVYSCDIHLEGLFGHAVILSDHLDLDEVIYSKFLNVFNYYEFK